VERRLATAFFFEMAYEMSYKIQLQSDVEQYLDTMKYHDRELRLFAVWCVRSIKLPFYADHSDRHLFNAIRVAENYANGQATRKELGDAWVAVKDVTRAVLNNSDIRLNHYAHDAVLAVTCDDARDAARNAAYGAGMAAGWSIGTGAWEEIRKIKTLEQVEELRRVCACIDKGEDPYPPKGDEKQLQQQQHKQGKEPWELTDKEIADAMTVAVKVGKPLFVKENSKRNKRGLDR